ncbi:lysosomal alpha-glucosidase-like isoform X2 [Tigriopus californicus]|nr:lysosomal alpha-glucosidase-like isoform X2 [Tigriopus californicus]
MTQKSPYPADVVLVSVEVRVVDRSTIQVKIKDANHARYEIPDRMAPVTSNSDPPELADDFVVSFVKDSFGFKISRKHSGYVLFDSARIGGFVFADQLLQISTRLPSNRIFGLGENQGTFLKDINWSTYTMWNFDDPPSPQATNIYGSHPFYLASDKEGSSHGVFLRNSNAMEVILQPTPALTFRAIGGILDFYLFIGPSPMEVVEQYANLIGKPALPPFWSLGYHQCKFGQTTLNQTKKILQQTIDAKIPIDTQWNDLDYMARRNDFTLDTDHFKDLPDFVAKLHENGMHYVTIIDPGVSGGEPVGSYPPYDRGIELDIFMKNSTGQPFVGRVWNPKSTVWPDFLNPKTIQYWSEMIQDFHDLVPIDGAWIDMNEPSNFWSGQFNGCSISERGGHLNHPPYVPRFVKGQSLFFRNICPSAVHYGNYSHYDVHNLFGHSETVVTNAALRNVRPGKRPFIISRSTFPGQGHYGGHWTGDIHSDWDAMRLSIAGVLNFNMFGIPLVGADICGFNGNTTVPLCQRWMELGAFYPFSRNHNTLEAFDQDPVSLGPEVVKAARKALEIRYSLLPYLYTLFVHAHLKGTPVAQPVFFQFPRDKMAYYLGESQFMWGSALMIAPVLEEGPIHVNCYLPQGVWYNWETHVKSDHEEGGAFVKIPAPLDTIPLLARGGSILVLKPPAPTTTDSRRLPFHARAYVSSSGSASGDLFWDDGDALDSYDDGSGGRHNHILFNLTSSRDLQSQVRHRGFLAETMLLDSISIIGLKSRPNQVTLDGRIVDFSYSPQEQLLEVHSLNVDLLQPFRMEL